MNSSDSHEPPTAAGVTGTTGWNGGDQLESYRASIDNIDAALIHLLAERFKITKAVGEYKAANGMPPADPAREERQLERLRALSDRAGLDPVFSEKFLRFVVDEVIQHHQRIAEARES